jgi:hypothetical protein
MATVRTLIRKRFMPLAAVVGLGIGSLVWASPASATTVSTEGQLRTAFGNASENSITLNADIELTCAGGGALTRNSATDVTITGNGHHVGQTCDDGVFDQAGTGSLTFNDLIISDAVDENGISSAGNVTVTHSTIGGVFGGNRISSGGRVTLNRSSITDLDVAGTGIRAAGPVALTGSRIYLISKAEGVVSHEAVTLVDSGIYGPEGPFECDEVLTDGPLTMTRSIVDGCARGVNAGGLVTLINSTATNAEFAISAPSVTLDLSTVAHNWTGVRAGSLESFGSVVAYSRQADCIVGSVATDGYNWDDDGTCDFHDSTDHSAGGDPLLGVVAINGGPTETLLPQSGSPLVDVIPPASCNQPTDQRGISRPQGDACEIGSVEIESAAPTTTTTAGAITTATTSAANPVAANPSFTG